MSEDKNIIYMVSVACALLLFNQPDTKDVHNREEEQKGYAIHHHKSP